MGIASGAKAIVENYPTSVFDLQRGLCKDFCPVPSGRPDSNHLARDSKSIKKAKEQVIQPFRESDNCVIDRSQFLCLSVGRVPPR